MGSGQLISDRKICKEFRCSTFQFTMDQGLVLLQKIAVELSEWKPDERIVWQDTTSDSCRATSTHKLVVFEQVLKPLLDLKAHDK